MIFKLFNFFLLYRVSGALFDASWEGMGNMFDIKYWSCLLKKSYSCPDNDIKFYLYTAEEPSIQKRIDVRSNIALNAAGWDQTKNNAIIIHGFNGTHKSNPLKLLRKAYLDRGDHNVFMVEWHDLGRFPCYLSALSNLKLVSQCSAQLYAYIMNWGGMAVKTVCVGHSLGAHICGMMSNYLDVKQFKIVGLDPARPLINQFSDTTFRLSREDAYNVQVVHTNAGLLGEEGASGHVNFCINGGMLQPGCKGNAIRRSRCSHFQSVCYFAQAVIDNRMFYGKPCTLSCPKRQSWGLLPGKEVAMGLTTPLYARGQYCVQIDHDNDCVFQ
ncbi:hypothetical protein PPYR_11656 [Photinus pyralis]|uniref:Lipase domain-containing protein n=1 Tax=Photinus pyralis TaxID=7054 RepID=A0A5N4ABW4_PHOPY|nr:lipase member H-A [Photinus pyralis]KAB0794817.1 hypothetical protein PPYR_11656 [Photinus pyralis]